MHLRMYKTYIYIYIHWPEFLNQFHQFLFIPLLMAKNPLHHMRCMNPATSLLWRSRAKKTASNCHIPAIGPWQRLHSKSQWQSASAISTPPACMKINDRSRTSPIKDEPTPRLLCSVSVDFVGFRLVGRAKILRVNLLGLAFWLDREGRFCSYCQLVLITCTKIVYIYM